MQFSLSLFSKHTAVHKRIHQFGGSLSPMACVKPYFWCGADWHFYFPLSVQGEKQCWRRFRWGKAEYQLQGCEEERRTKRICGCLDSRLVEYQQAAHVWRQNMHIMGFEDTEMHPRVYMDFSILFSTKVHMSYYQECPLGFFFFLQSKKYPKQNQNSSVKCSCSKQDQIRTEQEPRSKALVY